VSEPLPWIPPWARHAARVLLPTKSGDRLRDYVVEHYYAPGMVSRAGVFEYWWRRRVMHERPRLHRIVVHLTDHCNLNCRGCSHFSNLASPAFADFGQLDREFARLASLFDITEILLMGGEPLLHPNVIEFLPMSRRHFSHSKIVLVTNGILLPKMQPEFWRTMGEERITLMYDDYPIELKTDLIEERATENGIEVELAEHHDEFFELPIDFTASQDAADSFARCRTVANCPTLRDGRLYPCAYIGYIDLFSERFGVEGLEPGARDSIPIYETDDAYRIMDFLLNPVPWCAHCDFDSGENYEWGHSSRSIEEWTGGRVEASEPESGTTERS